MSNATGVLTVVGGAIGAYFTYGSPQGWQAGAALGAALGGAIGGAVDASKQRIEGPRLTDARTVTAEYGDVIPWIAGAARVGGQVWWVGDRREVGTTTNDGKGGGPKNTTYTYEQDILLGLASHTSNAVVRIWSNGKLIWTRKTGASGESLANSDGSNLWARITFYDGNPSQMPDPTYEASVGAGNAPAYRGRTSIMIEGLQLGTSGQMPNLTFEIITSGQYGVSSVSAGPSLPLPNLVIGSAASMGDTKAIIAVGQWDNNYATNEYKVYEFDVLGGFSYVSSFNKVAQYANPVHGSSNVPAVLMPFGAIAYLHIYPLWVSRVINFPAGDYELVRYALHNNDLYVCTAQPNNLAILKYSASAGGFPVATGALIAQTQSMCFINGKIYAAGKNTKQITVIDAQTLLIDTVINRPSFAGNAADPWPVVFDLGGSLGLLSAPVSQPQAHVYIGGQWVLLGDIPYQVAWGDSTTNPSVFVAGGLLMGILNLYLGADVVRTWSAPLTVSPGPVPLRDVVEDLCDRAGMPSSTYDASALAVITKPVRSLLLAQLGAARAALQPLQLAYHFDCTLTDKLYFRPRPTTAAATIPLDDLAAGVDKASGEPFSLTQGSDIELPAQIAVRYRNVENDYQTGVEVSDRLLSGQVAMQSIEVALGMTPSEAKALADVMVNDNLAGLTRGTVSLSMAYAHLQPADVVIIDGETMRLGRKQDARGVLTFEARRHDASTILSAGVTDASGYDSAATVTAPSLTTLQVLDVPLMRDADNGPGHYVAANGGTTWAGCSVQRSINNVDFTPAVTVLERAVFGTCTSTLGNFTGVGFDEVNSIGVTVGTGELASTTRDALLMDAQVNAILIGGEVIRFINAILTGTAPNRYTLTRLLRGQRGTEWAMAGHVAGERCVLLRPQGLRYVSTPQADIGATRYIKGVTNGLSASTATGSAYVNAGVSQKPFSPVNLRAARVSQGTYSLTWARRSRLQTTFANGLGVLVPLGESAEAYEVETYDAANVLIRTTSTATSSATIGGPGKEKTYAAGVLFPVEFSSKLYGVAYFGNLPAGQSRVHRFAANGSIEASSAAIPGTVWSAANNASGIYYVLTTESGPDGLVSACKLRRLDLATLTVTATVDLYALFSQVGYSITWDGSNIWSATITGATLRKHNPTTLAVEDTEVLTNTATAPITLASNGSGTVFAAGKDWTKIVSVNAGASSVNWTVDYAAQVAQITGLAYIGSKLFASGSAVLAIDPAAGAVDATHGRPIIGRVVNFAGNAAYASAVINPLTGITLATPGPCYVLSGTTGAEIDSFPLELDLVQLSGTAEGKLLAVSVNTGAGNPYLGHLYGPAPDLPGGRVVVYQMSSIVGRGYPAQITL